MTGSAIEGSSRRLTLRRSTGIGLVLALVLTGAAITSIATTAAWAQSDSAPTSLLPAAGGDKAAAPAPAVAVPKATPPGDNPVQVQQLQSIDPSGFGTLDENHGGLPIGIWAGTDRALAVKLIGTLHPTASRALHGLVRRLLLSVSTPPAVADGAKPDDAFLIARARALWGMGDTDDLAAFFQSLPLPSITPPLRRLRADTALLAGDTPTACAEAAPLAAASATDPYPVQLRVFCQFAQGQGAAAGIGIEVLREQNLKDPTFFTLADALSSGGSAGRTEITDPSPLTLAMARIAKAPVAVTANTAPPVLRSIAVTAGAPLDVRLAAAERAEAAGALDTDTLRRLYETVPFTADDIANAESKAKDNGPRSHALLFQAMGRQTAPLAKAGLIAKALNTEGPGYFVQARLYGQQIAALQPTADIALYVPALTRALIAARQFDAARTWTGWLRAEATADKGKAGVAAGFAVAGRIAKLEDAPLTMETLDAWRKAATPPAGAPATWAERRASLGVALLGAIGEKLPDDALLAEIDGAGLTEAQVPAPALSFGLDSAVQGKRESEIVLFATLAAGDGTFVQLDVATIARVVMALRAAGFDDDARALALEAALANGV